MRTIISTLTTLMFSLGLVSLVHADHHKGETEKDIVAIAVANKDFTTLVAAVKAGGLVETLQSKGPFTVFAPTNEAFAKLPKGTLETLLKPENKGTLASLLKYHVVPGKVLAKDVKAGSVPTALGPKATISVTDKQASIDGAKILTTDIVASNGVIHVIDAVILPPKKS